MKVPGKYPTNDVEVPVIKNVVGSLTVEDVAALMNRDKRFVKKLIRNGKLKALQTGGNSFSIQVRDYEVMIESGDIGFNGASPSGRFGKKNKEAK